MGERVDEKRGRLSKRWREREREREREGHRERRGEHENRGGKEKSRKTDVPKLHAYNECEQPVLMTDFEVFDSLLLC